MSREIMDLPPPAPGERIAYGPAPQQFIEMRYPPGRGSWPLLVHIHGGFWRNRYDLQHAGHYCAAFTAAGFATANVEYRRVGDPGGGWPGTLEDVRAALDLARRLTPGRAVVSGHSAGGHLALWLASERHDLAGTVALAPAACLHRAHMLQLGSGAAAEFMGASPEQAPRDYAIACPQHLCSMVPRILIHGTADDVVPIALSREFVEERKVDPGSVKLAELPGIDHFDIIDPRTEPWRIVFESVSSLVR